ncbi:uncharacterized protein [Notamacropus eugenii]|uniref:uncharacterized protein n=1 Tax=Notamacropus eugenii TaxID=9315 RepID=UPI003B67E12F
MSIRRWAQAGSRHSSRRHSLRSSLRSRFPRWLLTMAPRLLLLVLLCRVWPWVWAFEPPLAPAGPPQPTAPAGNGSPGAVIGTVTLTASSMAHKAFNRSGSRGLLIPQLNRTLQGLLFVLSGCCALTACFFMVREFIFNAKLMKNYGDRANAERREVAFTDSDERGGFNVGQNN